MGSEVVERRLTEEVRGKEVSVGRAEDNKRAGIDEPASRGKRRRPGKEGLLKRKEGGVGGG